MKIKKEEPSFFGFFLFEYIYTDRKRDTKRNIDSGSNWVAFLYNYVVLLCSSLSLV